MNFEKLIFHTQLDYKKISKRKKNNQIKTGTGKRISHSKIKTAYQWRHKSNDNEFKCLDSEWIENFTGNTLKPKNFFIPKLKYILNVPSAPEF